MNGGHENKFLVRHTLCTIYQSLQGLVYSDIALQVILIALIVWNIAIRLYLAKLSVDLIIYTARTMYESFRKGEPVTMAVSSVAAGLSPPYAGQFLCYRLWSMLLHSQCVPCKLFSVPCKPFPARSSHAHKNVQTFQITPLDIYLPCMLFHHRILKVDIDGNSINYSKITLRWTFNNKNPANNLNKIMVLKQCRQSFLQRVSCTVFSVSVKESLHTVPCKWCSSMPQDLLYFPLNERSAWNVSHGLHA